jgi:transcriptional regulator with XRE-family HTH domain
MDEKKITETIKKVRLSQQMSLEQLAKRTGLTRGYLSKIENSHNVPRFSTLLKIAKGLDVDIASLLFEDGSTEAPKDTKLSIVRANEKGGMDRKNNSNDYFYEPLAFRMRGKSMEPFIVLPSFENKDSMSHEGEEFIYVLEGTWEFMYGEQTYVFGQGDSLYFDSSVPHVGKSIGKVRAKVLAILYSGKRS